MTEPTEESDFVREIGMCFSPGGRLACNCPGFVSRPSQIAFAKIVARALENRETAVLEAGTGTGKTFAYLAPVLLSDRKAIVSTAGKTLQEQLFNKDFPALEAALGVHVTVKLLKGRSNYICLRRLKNVRQMGLPTKEAYEDLRIIERFAAVDSTGDRAGVEGVAEDSVIWPYVTSSRE
ncbi:MAG: ATP-dependent DNA helicase, partial [Sutterella sp.]|nr:ATP-dependent DNA helicase [Sutterella sp.]